MISSFPDLVKQWLEKADHDLLNAQTVIEYQPLILDTACFHCQQAVEKYLKSFLVFKKQDILKTHDIRFLLEQCSLLDGEFKNTDVKNIQDFAIDVRYPDNSINPSMEETKEYLEIANRIKSIVLKKINQV